MKLINIIWGLGIYKIIIPSRPKFYVYSIDVQKGITYLITEYSVNAPILRELVTRKFGIKHEHSEDDLYFSKNHPYKPRSGFSKQWFQMSIDSRGYTSVRIVGGLTEEETEKLRLGLRKFGWRELRQIGIRRYAIS